MTQIAINDLHESKALDSNAMSTVRGGHTAMTNSLVTTMAAVPTLKLHQPSLYPSSFYKQSLNNFSEQLNIVVGSANVMQGNSNSVTQY